MRKIIAGILIFITVMMSPLTGQQQLATLVFLSLIMGTLFYWRYRLAFAFGGIAILLASHLIDVPHIIEFASLDIILFLMGMMTLIGYLEEKHFFEVLVASVEDRVGKRAFLMMGILMGVSALLAALVDEVTSILVMVTSLFHLLRRYKVNPIPFLLMIVFATNIGSSATAVGNPIGVMIALRANFSFLDFLRWATPISIVVLTVCIPLCQYIFYRPIKELESKMMAQKEELHELDDVSYNPKDMKLCWLLFLGTIFSLIGHVWIEQLLGLPKNTMLMATSLGAGSIAIVLSGEQARTFFMEHVDWWTLSFFMLLFASVGTLSYVGVTERISAGILYLAGNELTSIFLFFSTAIAVLTALMDNVLAVATFIPIIGDIKDVGVTVFPLWWGMLMSGTMFGNLTVIGSTANIVAMGQLEKEYGKHITFWEWFKPGVVVGVITWVIALFLLWIQFPLMG